MGGNQLIFSVLILHFSGNRSEWVNYKEYYTLGVNIQCVLGFEQCFIKGLENTG